MSAELSGRLRERVTIARPDGGRDALGAADGGWTALGDAWAAIEPAGSGAGVAGEARAALPTWHVTVRARDLRPGDRIGWDDRMLIVREVRMDPMRADRLVASAEEQR